MSSFLLLLEICENLASAISQFWWSSNPQKRWIHWAKMGKLYLPREEDGTGFRMIHEFNLALLAKQLWQLFQCPYSSVARVLRGKYYIMSSHLRISSINNPSYVWTSISAVHKLLLLGITQKIILDMRLMCGRTLGSLPHRLGRVDLLPLRCTRKCELVTLLMESQRKKMLDYYRIMLSLMTYVNFIEVWS